MENYTQVPALCNEAELHRRVVGRPNSAPTVLGHSEALELWEILTFFMCIYVVIFLEVYGVTKQKESVKLPRHASMNNKQRWVGIQSRHFSSMKICNAKR